MRETTDILSAWRNCREKAALATVVAVEGSSYRRPGARMLILADGSTLGGISGGCIDRDVVYRASALFSGSESIVVRYDSALENDAPGKGSSLGCGGTVDILIEPLIAGESNPLVLLDRLWTQHRRRVLATVIASSDPTYSVGWRKAIDESGPTSQTDSFVRSLFHDSLTVLESGRSEWRAYSTSLGSVRVFLELIEPPAELLVFGAGPDAAPLASMAKLLGWRVTIVDLRSAIADSARRFDADELVRCHVDELPERLPISAGAFAVVMTHHYPHDLAVLKHLESTHARYVGVLGPRHRTLQLFKELGKNPDQQNSLHAPVGLDIGAQTPQEIALAIMAEIVSVYRGRRGGMLRDRPGPIYLPRPAPESASGQNFTCPTVAS
jgi:xanthine dehydrogenase accessory factor